MVVTAGARALEGRRQASNRSKSSRSKNRSLSVQQLSRANTKKTLKQRIGSGLWSSLQAIQGSLENPRWNSHQGIHLHKNRFDATRKAAASIAEKALLAQASEIQSHFAILQLGVPVWNEWRASDPLTVPNLQNVDLRGFHLENINLCRANLRGANLSGTYLYDADFQEADLRGANLTRAGLIGANLCRANLRRVTAEKVYLAQSDLSNADFSRACLRGAAFQNALLSGTALDQAQIAEADLTTGFDLTLAQLKQAKGAHQASLAPELRVRFAMEPTTQQVEKALALEHSQTDKAHIGIMTGMATGVTPLKTGEIALPGKISALRFDSTAAQPSRPCTGQPAIHRAKRVGKLPRRAQSQPQYQAQP